jgi:hypothetical protein
MMSDIKGVLSGMGDLFKELDDDMAKLADECDSETKIAVTQWVMKHIVEHAHDGGSFRYLIYDRLGFGPEAYVPLCSFGMTISNEFDLHQKEKITEVVKAEGYDKLKMLLNLCDEVGCYLEASNVWPSEKVYRHTCGNHYKNKMEN